MADFRARFGRIVKRLIVEVLVGLGAKYVTGFAQRVPVRFSRSSYAFFAASKPGNTDCTVAQKRGL